MKITVGLKRLLSAAAFGALLLGTIPAEAANPIILSQTTFSDLGPGPIYLSAINGSIIYIPSATQPPTGGSGHMVRPLAPKEAVNTQLHIWARSAAVQGAGTGMAIVSPISPEIQSDQSNATHLPGYCQISVPGTLGAGTSMATMLAAGVGGTCSVPSWATSVMFYPESTVQVAIKCISDTTTLSTILGFPMFGNVENPEPSVSFGSWSCVTTTGAPILVDLQWRG